MINDRSRHFFQSLLVIGHHASVTVHTQTKSVVGLPPCLPVTNPKMEWVNGKGELANKDETAAKKQKVITLERKQS